MRFGKKARYALLTTGDILAPSVFWPFLLPPAILSQESYVVSSQDFLPGLNETVHHKSGVQEL